MLRIAIELIPHGDESRKRLIAAGVVANDGTGTTELGNYYGVFTTAHGDIYLSRTRKFKRLEQSVWELLGRLARNMKRKGGGNGGLEGRVREAWIQLEQQGHG